MRNEEYDRFGPWIYEITGKDPLPPLFIPYIKKKSGLILSIKIPRSIERRDAKPGWNLYDYVINMFEQEFDIYRREGNDVITDNFRYDDIEAIIHGESLLSGSLRIICSSNSYEFNYSTVSGKIIQKLVNIIRERFMEPGKSLKTEEAHPEKDELDFYFTNLLSLHRETYPDLKLFAYQTRIRLSSLEEGFFGKIYNLAIMKQLLESMHFCGSRELKIINRGRTFKFLNLPVYGKTEYYYPLRKIESIEIFESGPNQLLKNCRIHTHNGNFEFSFAFNNSTVDSYKKIMANLHSVPQH